PGRQPGRSQHAGRISGLCPACHSGTIPVRLALPKSQRRLSGGTRRCHRHERCRPAGKTLAGHSRSVPGPGAAGKDARGIGAACGKRQCVARWPGAIAPCGRACMIELSALLWVMAIFFAIIGFLRGWTKEIVSTAGIILGLFALFQFDTLIRGTLLANVGRDQVFIVQAGLFIIIVYFAYQTRALYGNERGPGRDALQESVLGGFLGFLNGYLIWGSIWYFLDINEYPLAPYVIAPAP